LDDERVAVPVTDGVAHPRRVRILRHLTAVEKDLAVGEILEEKDDYDRRLDDFGQSAARDVTRTAGLAARDFRIVFAEIPQTLPRQLRRPGLNIGSSKVGGDVRRVPDLDAELPQPGEIRMSVGSAWRRRREIRFAVGRPRHTWRGLLEPLCV